MPASFNQVILMGNLTRDPEVRYTPKGTACCQIGLALNRKWTTEGGESREDVTYVDVTIWGSVGEGVARYHRKGDPIHISGRLKLDTWEDKRSGTRRQKLSVVGESVQFIKPHENRAPTTRPTAEPAGGSAPEPQEEDDVPF